MNHLITRRHFLCSTSTGIGLGLCIPGILSARSPNETVRIAAVGVGGKGWTDVNGAAKHGEIVAFCDVDTGKHRKGGYGAAAEKWPKAKRFTDFRKLIEKHHQSIDAITVSTPDHMHAPITMLALQHGLAVYTQKPLTRTIYEARALTTAAKDAKVSTQMGNQHHSGSGYRTLVKIVQGGTIGKIREAHAWSNRPVWPQGLERPQSADPVPNSLDWNLWLGGAPQRPFKKAFYHPFKWRGWFDFGAGALGDMGCHIIDPVVWSLELGAPTSVSYQGPKPKPETFPTAEVLTYQFPGTNFTANDELTMTWYDGGRKPSSDRSHVPDTSLLPDQGVLLIGEKGTLVCSHGGQPELFPKEKFSEMNLPREVGLDHYGVWVEGIRTGNESNSSFAYAGKLTETVLIGVIASRVGAEKLLWDTKNLRFTNSEKANQFVKEDYRKGWAIDGLT